MPDKTQKLKQLFRKLQQVRQDVRDVKEENGRERAELENTVNQLEKELKLRHSLNTHACAEFTTRR